MDRQKAKRRAAAAAVPVLPDDALAEILSRVTAKSLCRSKCVSKPWRDLIAGRLRCTSLPQTLAGFFYVYDDGDEEVRGCTWDGDGHDGCAGSDRVVGRFVNPSGRSVPFFSFAFLGRQPEIQQFGMLSSCNGLVLFGHRQFGDSYDTLGYIVCNPATEQWLAVPSSGWQPLPLYKSSDSDSDSDSDTDEGNCKFTYMIFDPAASPHFQLVEFWTPTYDATTVEEVHTYSFETRVWSKRMCTWDEDEAVAFAAGGAIVNGMLHLSATRFERGKNREILVAVDGEGKNRRVIRGRMKCCNPAFVSKSQGRLHFVDEHRDSTRGMAELSIWVLQDYDKEEWVLKHGVSFLNLFGRMDCQANLDFSVIGIHPDCNLIFFFFQHWDLKLKSYDMDRQEVSIVRTLGVGRQTITPYVPYFAESPALASKH